jgi:PAS domain S-box-containing protein
MEEPSITGVGALLDRLFDDSCAAHCLVAPDGSILRVNQAWLRATGLERRDALGADVALLFKRTRDLALSMREPPAAAGGHVDLPRHARCIEGCTTWWEGSFDPVPVEGGMGLFATLREEAKPVDRPSGGEAQKPPSLEAMRRLEDSLRESEERFRALVEQAASAFFLHRFDGRFLDVNRQACERLGYTREELLRMGVPDVEADYELETLQREWARARPGVPSTLYGHNRRKDGTTFPVEIHFACLEIRGERLFMALSQDITERRRVEQALRESEQRFRLALRNAPVSVAAQDRGLRYVWAYNQRTARPEDLLGKLDADIFKVEEAERLSAIKRRVLSSDVEHREQMWLDRPSGRIYLDIFFEPIHDDAGQVVGVASTAVDLTPMKVAQEALRASEGQYRLLFVANPNPMFVFDEETLRFLAVNDAAVRTYGWSRDEFLAMTLLDVRPPEDRALAREMVAQNPRVEETYLGVVRHRRKDGAVMDMEVTASSIVMEGRPGRLCSMKDVTERKRAADQVAAERERLMVTLRSIGDAVIATDLDGRITILNDAAEGLTGWKADEALGRPLREVFRVISEDTRQETLSPMDRVLKEGVVVELANHTALLARDGTERPIADSGAPIRDSKGRVCGAVLVFRDQTKERRVERVLRESEERLRLALDAAKAGTWVWDLRTNENSWSDGLWRLYGLEPPGREPSYDAWRNSIHQDDRERVERTAREAVRTGSELNVEWRVGSGDRARWLTSRGRPVRDGHGAVTHYMGIVLDTTERKQAEEALRESEQRFAAIYDHAPYAIALINHSDGTLAAVNGAWERMFGYSRAEAIGKTSATLGLASDLEGLRRMYSEIREKGSVSEWEMEYTTRAGDPRLGAFNFKLVDVGGRKYHLGTAMDVTDRKRSEMALRQSEERFRALIEKSTDLILLLDAKGQYRFWSQGATAMLGWTPEEKVGRPALEMIHPDDQPRMAEALGGLLAGLEATTRDVLRYRHKDGSWRQIEATARNLLGDPAVAGVVVNGRDITAQRGLEEQLRQAQKLESVGRLAGGVAHDFNNLLTVILSCAESLDDAVSRGHPASVEEVRDIRTAGKRASDLTHQLLAFARKQIIAPVPLDLGAVVHEGEKMLGRLLGEDVRVQVRLQPDLWTIDADPGQVTQVLVNLAVNARDAMPGGGTLAIETRNVSVTPDQTRRDSDEVPGEWVRLALRDSGVGMTPEVRAHLFEPFYTTKEQGKGTGLGLATVYGIVKQAGGHVHVESMPGQGTTIGVCFPRAHSNPKAATPAEVSLASTGTERVLVVEDDPQVRAVTVRTLRAAGYEVLSSTGAQGALDLSEEEFGGIRLLITDVVMPGLNGHALAEEMRRRHPGLRVLYLSGYTHDIIAARGVIAAGIELLPKPFTGPTLLARVRTILDAS